MNQESNLNGNPTSQDVARNKKKIFLFGGILWAIMIILIVVVYMFPQLLSTAKETSVSFSSIVDNGTNLVLTSEDFSKPFKINDYSEYDPDLAQKISHRSANELYKVKYESYSKRNGNSGYYWIVSLVDSEGIELVSEKESSLPSRIHWPSFLITGVAFLVALLIAVLKVRKSGEEQKSALHDLLHKKGWGKPKE